MLILTTASTGGGEEDNIILPTLDNFELFIRNKLKDVSYGADINDCIFYIYSVFPDRDENIKWGMRNNRIERRKDYYGNNGWIKTIVFVLLFDPSHISKMTNEEFKLILCNTILKRLEDPQMKILKAFDYEAFKQDVAKEIIFFRDNIPFKQL